MKPYRLFVSGPNTPRWFPPKSREGMVLPTMLILLFILILVGLSFATQAIAHRNNTSRSVHVSNGLLAAETGAEMTLHELNKDSSFSGFNETEFYSNQHQGRATYETDVVDGTISNEKNIISTGRLYANPGDTEPVATRGIRIVVVGTTANEYVVHSGPGGLIMSNSATIANGPVHVNGFIHMSNTSQIGTQATPALVEAAHVNCPDPPDSTYPSLCSSGEPIDMQNKAHIYGEVYATNQTDGSQMSHTGLVSGSTASEEALPDYDRQAHKDAVSKTISSNWSCKGSDSEIWEDGLKIDGDVTIRGKCEVTIEGDIWITGDLTIRNAASLIVNDSLTEMPTLMIDGPAGLRLRNSATIVTNEDGVGAEFITFYAKASCSPDCSNLSGSELYDSQSVITIDINNSTLAAGSVFYARWSRVGIYNAGSIGSILGQSIELSNTGVISLGKNLSSGTKIWTIKNYQQIYQ